MNKSTTDKLTRSAIKYLTYRPRSTQEIRDYLGRKYSGEDQELVIDQVVNHLEEFNLLNDEEFASQWASFRLNHGKGPIIIRIELKKKGVNESQISSALSEINQQSLENSAAKQLEKYSSKLQGLQINRKKAKAYRYLYSRGFESATINPVIDDVVVGKVK